MPGVGQEVSVAGVEPALAAFWQSQQALTKASLINLLILSGREDSLAANHQRVDALTRDHACRVLLVEARAEGPAVEARAWITAHCHLAGGRRSVCSEQLAFLLDARVPGLVRVTLLAHLLSDLPVVCWWQGEPGPLFEPGLLRSIDRLIVDSSTFRPAVVQDQIRRILAVQGAFPQPFALHDLAWTRSFPTRLALASLCDHPQAQAQLGGVRRVLVTAPEGDFASGLLLGAWIAHTLGWEFAGCARRVSRWRHPSGHADIVFRRDASERPALRLELESTSGRIRVAPSDDGTHIIARATTGPDPVEAIVPCRCQDLASLVAGVISRGGRNAPYQSLLPTFLRLAGPCAECTGCEDFAAAPPHRHTAR